MARWMVIPILVSFIIGESQAQCPFVKTIDHVFEPGSLPEEYKLPGEAGNCERFCRSVDGCESFVRDAEDDGGNCFIHVNELYRRQRNGIIIVPDSPLSYFEEICDRSSTPSDDLIRCEEKILLESTSGSLGDGWAGDVKLAGLTQRRLDSLHCKKHCFLRDPWRNPCVAFAVFDYTQGPRRHDDPIRKRGENCLRFSDSDVILPGPYDIRALECRSSDGAIVRPLPMDQVVTDPDGDLEPDAAVTEVPAVVIEATTAAPVAAELVPEPAVTGGSCEYLPHRIGVAADLDPVATASGEEQAGTMAEGSQGLEQCARICSGQQLDTNLQDPCRAFAVVSGKCWLFTGNLGAQNTANNIGDFWLYTNQQCYPTAAPVLTNAPTTETTTTTQALTTTSTSTSTTTTTTSTTTTSTTTTTEAPAPSIDLEPDGVVSSGITGCGFTPYRMGDSSDVADGAITLPEDKAGFMEPGSAGNQQCAQICGANQMDTKFTDPCLGFAVVNNKCYLFKGDLGALNVLDMTGQFWIYANYVCDGDVAITQASVVLTTESTTSSPTSSTTSSTTTTPTTTTTASTSTMAAPTTTSPNTAIPTTGAPTMEAPSEIVPRGMVPSGIDGCSYSPYRIGHHGDLLEDSMAGADRKSANMDPEDPEQHCAKICRSQQMSTGMAKPCIAFSVHGQKCFLFTGDIGAPDTNNRIGNFWIYSNYDCGGASETTTTAAATTASTSTTSANPPVLDIDPDAIVPAGIQGCSFGPYRVGKADDLEQGAPIEPEAQSGKMQPSSPDTFNSQCAKICEAQQLNTSLQKPCIAFGVLDNKCWLFSGDLGTMNTVDRRGAFWIYANYACDGDATDPTQEPTTSTTTAAPADYPVVMTTKGEVEGVIVTVNGVEYGQFKGIPYAKPPLGALRFKKPEPPDEWEPERKDVGGDGAGICVQFFSTAQPQTEDCLYLNILTPKSSSADRNKYPVLFFIHGGTFLMGSARDFTTDIMLDNVVKHGVVIVQVQYRLGPLGFYYNREAGYYGNYGLYDVLMALDWVQREIEPFGGDPEAVTIVGESAGATGVKILNESPHASGLFHRAIVMSAPSEVVLPETPFDFAPQLTRALCASEGASCDLPAVLENTPIQSLVNAAFVIFQSLPRGGVFMWGPVREIGGITESSVQNAGEVMIGTMHDEMVFFASLEHKPSMAVYPEFLSVNAKTLGLGFRNSEVITMALEAKYVEGGKSLFSPIEDEEELALKWAHRDWEMMQTAVFHAPAFLHASQLVAGDTKVFFYSMDYVSEEGFKDADGNDVWWKGSVHTYDLHILFGFEDTGFIWNLTDRLPLTSSQEDQDMRARTGLLWTNFVKYGDPSLADFTWKPFEPSEYNFAVLDKEVEMRQGYHPNDVPFYIHFVIKLGLDEGRCSSPFPFFDRANPQQTRALACHTLCGA